MRDRARPLLVSSWSPRRLVSLAAAPPPPLVSRLPARAAAARPRMPARRRRAGQGARGLSFGAINNNNSSTNTRRAAAVRGCNCAAVPNLDRLNCRTRRFALVLWFAFADSLDSYTCTRRAETEQHFRLLDSYSNRQQEEAPCSLRNVVERGLRNEVSVGTRSRL